MLPQRVPKVKIGELIFGFDWLTTLIVALFYCCRIKMKFRRKLSGFVVVIVSLLKHSIAADRECLFTVTSDESAKNVSVRYNDELYNCVKCGEKRRVLDRVQQGSAGQNSVCSDTSCDGVICRARTCISIASATQAQVSRTQICRTGKLDIKFFLRH